MVLPPLFGRPDDIDVQAPSGDLSNLAISVRDARKAGYQLRSVPNAEDRIHACIDTIGSGQILCWAHLDQYLMEQLAPIVPLFQVVDGFVFSPRVLTPTLDQYEGAPSLDQLAFRRSAP